MGNEFLNETANCTTVETPGSLILIMNVPVFFFFFLSTYHDEIPL